MNKQLLIAGTSFGQATKALVLVHGRGATADDILSLADHLNVAGYALLAPQAPGNTWYPYSFLSPVQNNEPYLSAALEQVYAAVEHALAQGIAPEQVYLAGFSQGACLTAEYAARHARRYGGLALFTGGLIGEQIDRSRYQGDFQGTPVFIGSANPDFHVPVERVYATANILREMGAAVTEKVYAGMGHTIIPDEMVQANRFVFRSAPDEEKDQ
jgi:phospholipase/carboxylesterase